MRKCDYKNKVCLITKKKHILFTFTFPEKKSAASVFKGHKLWLLKANRPEF